MSNRKKTPPAIATVDATEQEEAAAALMEETIEIATATLTGDVRDKFLDMLRFQQDKRPWNQRSEQDQRQTVHTVETLVHDLVRRSVELIAAQGRRTVKAVVEQVTIKDGIKAVLTLSRHDEQRHALADATGHTVLLVVADPDEYIGERAPAKINPDQPELMATAGVVHSAPDGEPERGAETDIPFAA